MKISFIIPAYNSEKTIKRCALSCASQKSPNLDIEIIIVDDGSDDKTPEIITELKKDIPEIVSLKQKNQGVSVARNNGIDLAQGDYIMFVDADDYLTNNVICPFLEIMTDNNLCVLAHGAIVENEEEPYSKTVPVNIPFDSPNSGIEYIRTNSGPYRVGSVGGAWAFILNNQFLKDSNVRFIERLPFGEDSLFYLSLLPKDKRVSFTSSCFYHYVQQSQSVMHKKYDICTIADATLMRCEANRKLSNEFQSDPDLKDIINSRLISILFSRVFLKIIKDKIDFATAKEIQKQFEETGFWPLPELPNTHRPYQGFKAFIYNLCRRPAIYNFFRVISRL